EALYIATMLCKLGYYFNISVGGPTLVHRDRDLYRFQLTVVLTQLSTATLQEMKKSFQDQWKLIVQIAEAQLRVMKGRKKSDRVVMESQERAFWSLIKMEDKSIFDCDVRMTLLTQFPTTEQKLKFQIDHIKNQLIKQDSMQSRSHTHLLLCHFVDIESDYDAFINKIFPLNPWIVDDASLWQYSQDIVSDPDQHRIKHWSVSFKNLLCDPTGISKFMEFCCTEFSQENLKFYLNARDMRTCSYSKLKIILDIIVREHILPNAAGEVNLEDIVRSDILNNQNNPTFGICFIAEQHIFELMKKNSYNRFLNSDFYQNLLRNAPIQITKKCGLLQFVKQSTSMPNFKFEDSEIFSGELDGCVATLRK
ncbi:hypothetical protein GJ496_000816, partial [Pomphorhynchus laevis]